MKFKKLLMLLPLLCVLLLSAAGCSETFKLTVEDPEGYLIEKLDSRYSAGRKVTVKTEIIDCAEISVYLDGVSLGSPTAVDTDGQYSHWEFCFVMPAHDAVLSLEISWGGTICPPEPAELYDGSFYSLGQAYEQGYLTVDDLKSIAYYKNRGNYGNEEIIPDDFVPAEKTALNEEIELSIKYAYLDDLKKYVTAQYDEYTVDNVSVDYYGTYGDSVVVMTDSAYVGYAEVIGCDTVGEVKFFYGNGNRLSVWRQQDDVETEQKVKYAAGVEYGGKIVGFSWAENNIRVESLFLNYEHFGRFTRSKNCFPDGPNGEENVALAAMKEKYNEEYFEQNALICVKFFSPTWGGAFKNVSLTRRGDKLFLDYEYDYGDSDAICYPALVLEISKADLHGADILRVNFKR